jgi:hypothetical protein
MSANNLVASAGARASHAQAMCKTMATAEGK